MAKKIAELSNVEMFAKFYSQSLTAAQYVHQALIGACCDAVKAFEDEAGSQAICASAQAIVSFMENKDPGNKLVQTNSIYLWLKEVAGFQISNFGKPEASIVRPMRFEPHNREWLEKVRNSDSWDIHGRKKQDAKPVTDPTEQVARQMATYVAMGGMQLSELEVGMPAIVAKVKSLLKDTAFNDKIDERKAKLDEKGMDYVKV
jgi:hypothetical protein